MVSASHRATAAEPLIVPEPAWREACSDLDLRAVRCLLVLGEEQHYGRAAVRVHMSQPGLSRAIAALERRVGTSLVIRSSRPVRLTEQGLILAVHGRRLLAEQRHAFRSLAESLAGDADRCAAPGVGGRPSDATAPTKLFVGDLRSSGTPSGRLGGARWLHNADTSIRERGGSSR